MAEEIKSQEVVTFRRNAVGYEVIVQREGMNRRIGTLNARTAEILIPVALELSEQEKAAIAAKTEILRQLLAVQEDQEVHEFLSLAFRIGQRAGADPRAVSLQAQNDIEASIRALLKKIRSKGPSGGDAE